MRSALQYILVAAIVAVGSISVASAAGNLRGKISIDGSSTVYPITEGVADGSYFYFVHSYHGVVTDAADALGITEYGTVFPSLVRHGNVWGMQFHPEKSQNAGLRLLKNFAALRPA